LIEHAVLDAEVELGAVVLVRRAAVEVHEVVLDAIAVAALEGSDRIDDLRRRPGEEHAATQKQIFHRSVIGLREQCHRVRERAARGDLIGRDRRRPEIAEERCGCGRRARALIREHVLEQEEADVRVVGEAELRERRAHPRIGVAGCVVTFEVEGVERLVPAHDAAAAELGERLIDGGIVRDDAERFADLARRAGDERALEARGEIALELRHHAPADRVHVRVVRAAAAIRVEESRLEVGAERVVRLEPPDRADDAVEVVLEALRIVGDEPVVREDEEEALRLAPVALLLRLEALERLRREEDAVDAVAAP
jgi:hypothetical protein